MTAAQIGIWDAPPAPPPRPRKQLWPNQVTAVDTALMKLQEHPSTLIVRPTGTGKTITACEIVRRWLAKGGAVLWLAHRDELIDQARKALEEHTGFLAGKEKAEDRAQGERLVVASVQTLKGERLASFGRRHAPTLIVIDEAHHAVAPSYRAIVAAFPAAKVLGLTATPDRADEKAMGQVFESVAAVYEILDAINDGYLCQVVRRRVLVDAIDLSKVGTVAGDFNQGELDAVMAAEKVLHGIAEPLIREAGDRRTIVFTTSVDNAHRLAEIINRYKTGSARAVDGGTQIDLRRRTLRDHREGAYQFLVNVGVLTEGYDDPAVSCVAMARPTKSRALYAQCAGRGLRIFPGKADCLLIDFVGNNGRHSLVYAEDILAGKFDDEVVARARKKLDREGAGKPIVEALEEAQREIEERKAREAARREAAKARVSYRTEAADPFGVFGIKDPGRDAWSDRFGQEATPRQIEALAKWRITPPPNCTREQARKLLDTAGWRAGQDLANFKQMKYLRSLGYTGTAHIKFREASALIDQLKADRASGARQPGQEG